MILRPFKKIREQEDIINRLQRENTLLKSREEKKDSGEHGCGVWCTGCKNLMKEKTFDTYYGEYETKFCKLDIPCEDREE